jgi:hypothetical protein
MITQQKPFQNNLIMKSAMGVTVQNFLELLPHKEVESF